MTRHSLFIGRVNRFLKVSLDNANEDDVLNVFIELAYRLDEK